MSVTNAIPSSLRSLLLVCALGGLTAACSSTPRQPTMLSEVDPQRLSVALREVRELRSEGRRVWCVPFARNASGIEIRGNAHTWWHKAKGEYARGDTPQPGAVMSFAPTGSMRLGHIAVVARVISPREIEVHHANWERNEVSLAMPVIDVSSRGDWSEVRVKSQPTAFGSVYPVNGFIYPDSRG
ncbi:CHAP domain-containing protein [Salipiger mucosus]|uniref:Chap n=1 Tax=Salipiger mucosus DSM 16094 TaxID=1123237 RepID=S9QE00_9RHOB|nr:CHAP domain-containing protein [Salipiger mucosus]EPX79656.1 chap [Salipiger mucosus DSM 16094]